MVLATGGFPFARGGRGRGLQGGFGDSGLGFRAGGFGFRGALGTRAYGSLEDPAADSGGVVGRSFEVQGSPLPIRPEGQIKTKCFSMGRTENCCRFRIRN